MGIKIDILTPFDHCQDCKFFEMKDDAVRTNLGETWHMFSCVNERICENAARIYLKDLEERNTAQEPCQIG